MQTATNPQTGEKLVLQGGKWVPAGSAPLPATAAPVVSRVVGTRRPDKPTDVLDAQGKGLTNAGKIYDNQTKPVYDRANAMDKVRDGFRQDKRVLMFEAAAPIYASALTSPDTPESDILLVNAIAKIGDPSTGVQQREGDAYEGAASTFEQVKTRLAKEFGVDGAGNFTTEGRKRIKEAIRNRGAAIGDQYRLARREHVEYINSLGLPDVDPETIIGPSAALPFQAAESAYLGRPLRVGAAPQGAQEKPSADSIKFGPQEDPMGFRMTPEQSKQFASFLSANNGKLTPEGMTVAYQAITGMSLNPEKTKELADYLNKGGDPAKVGVNYSEVDGAAEAAARADLESQRRFSDLETPAETLIKSGMGLNFTDEAAGVGRGIAAGLTGNNPIEGYTRGRDAERLRIADARQQLGYGGSVLEIAGGFLSANPGGALSAATGTRALVAQGARQGAGVGALAGYGSGEGFSDSAGKSVLGGVLGAAIGGGISGLSARAAPRGMAPDLIEAAGRQDVRLNAGMVDPARRNSIAALEASTVSSPRVNAALDETTQSIEAATTRLGAGGNAQPGEMAGETVQNAGRRFIERSRGTATRLYDRAEQLAGGATVDAANARQQIAQEIAELEATPNINQGELAFMRELAADLEGPLNVGAVRGLRTSLRGRIGQSNLTSSQAEARAMRVMDAASRDVVGAVPPEAARAFERADGFYRERQTYINDIVQKFIGRRDSPISGGDAFKRLKAMAKPDGDGRRLAGMMRALSPGEQADVGATIAESLGRRAPDEPFSAALFVSQAKNLSPAARRTIFGPNGEQAIGDLLALSREQAATVGRLNNSASGRVINYRAQVGQMLGLGGGGVGVGLLASGGSVAGGAVGLAAGAAVSGLSAAFRGLSARVMMSRGFANWLARIPTAGTATAAQYHIQRLGNVAARDPAIAGELAPLQKALETQFRPLAVASEDEGQADDKARQ